MFPGNQHHCPRRAAVGVRVTRGASCLKHVLDRETPHRWNKNVKCAEFLKIEQELQRHLKAARAVAVLDKLPPGQGHSPVTGAAWWKVRGLLDIPQA